jgi:chromosome segregation ATPase
MPGTPSGKSRLLSGTNSSNTNGSTPTSAAASTVAPMAPNIKFKNKILGISAIAEHNGVAKDHEDPSFAQLTSAAFPMGTASSTINTADSKEINNRLEQELARRQESYIRRERQYKARIQELETQLSDVKRIRSPSSTSNNNNNSSSNSNSNSSHVSNSNTNSSCNVDSNMDQIRQLHHNILESVGQVQERTSKILQEQEKDLLRAFRARLYSVQAELESEKHRTDDGASAWIEKAKHLENEMEWTKELADRLDRLNQSLSKENQRLKAQFTSQENDREFLLKQLVQVKKDNTKMKNDMEALQIQHDQIVEEMEVLKQQQSSSSGSQTQPTSTSTMTSTIIGASASLSALPRVHPLGITSHHPNHALFLRPNTLMSQNATAGTQNNSGGASLPEADNRYKEIIKRLKRLLEVERRNLQQLRNLNKQDLDKRTELEDILKQCIHDVREEITRQHQHAATKDTNLSLSGGIGPLNTQERAMLIEKLLAQERVLSLLTTKAFPIKTPFAQNQLLHGMTTTTMKSTEEESGDRTGESLKLFGEMKDNSVSSLMDRIAPT